MKKVKTNKLIISVGDGNGISNVLQRLMRKLKKRNASINNLQHLRSSVICLWVKKHNIRVAQYMAGHKYVSSTERYKQQDLKDLQDDLVRYYPIK